MRFLSVILCASALQSAQVFAAFRPDLRDNVQVAQLEPEHKDKITAKTLEIPMKAYPGSDFEIIFRCTDSKKQFTLTDGKEWVACCLPGQTLLGSEGTAFDCCASEEVLIGDKDTNRYKCCADGQTYDGRACRTPGETVGPGSYNNVTCTDGEIVVNGYCVCPAGTSRGIDGTCQPLECSSGLQTGKCYTFTFENGYRFGYNTAGFYTASDENRTQQFGKFQLCADENCTAAVDINPGDAFSIKDIHGEANGGKNPNQWLNDASNGAHITKTPNYEDSGDFILTKWPCGKYCLSGAEAGVGPTCPTEMVGATFTTLDDQSCIPVTLLEVPCDIRAAANNCIWDSKADQCGGYRNAVDVTCPPLLIVDPPALVNGTQVPVAINASVVIDVGDIGSTA